MRCLLAVVMCSSLAFACGEVPTAVDGGSDGGVDAADAGVDPCAGPLTPDEFITCVSQAACGLVADCFGSAVGHLDCDVLPINVFDGLELPAARRVLADSLARSRATWDPAAAASCLLPLRGCGLIKSENDLLDGCAAITGRIADGAPCQAAFECRTAGAECRSTGASEDTCGATVCVRPAGTGSSCAGGAFCGVGDHCVRRFTGGLDQSTCESGATNRPCDSTSNCDTGLFCAGGLDDGTAAGTCAASGPAGTPCSEDRECQGELLCVGETSTTSGTCRDVRAPGAACDQLLGCFGGQACTRAGTTGLGTCGPAPTIGGACGVFSGTPWCGVTLACDGTCQPAGDVGATCTRSGDGIFSNQADGCNTGLHCSNAITGTPSGQCAAPRAAGQACTSDGQCTTGYCDGTTRTCAPYPLCAP